MKKNCFMALCLLGGFVSVSPAYSEYTVPTASSGLLLLDSFGRYASDHADIARLSAQNIKALVKPAGQKVYDATFGIPRMIVSSIATGISSLLILPIQRLSIEGKTERFFNLSPSDRRAYLAGLTALSEQQRGALLALQKKLRILARKRLVSQLVASGSTLPFCVHGLKYGGERYVGASHWMLGLGFAGLIGGFVADNIYSVKFRNEYADWVRKVIARGSLVLKEQRKNRITQTRRR